MCRLQFPSGFAESILMRLSKLSWKIYGGILMGILGVCIVTYALWPQPQFSFLRGQQPVRDDDDVHGYELTGNPVELSRRIDIELTGRGFKRIKDDRWSQGRNVEYLSADERTQLFLVWEADRPQLVTFWSRSMRKPGKFVTIINDVWCTLGFTRPSRCTYTTRGACIANLKQLDGAEAVWALENPNRTNEVPKDADLFGPQSYIRRKPECPGGGHYILGKAGEAPRCSIPWHSLE
jgi:hypothetical protein